MEEEWYSLIVEEEWYSLIVAGRNISYSSGSQPFFSDVPPVKYFFRQVPP